jgi:hypothetical protein
VPTLHVVWPQLQKLREIFEKISNDYTNLFKRCLAKSALSALDLKMSNLITIQHRVASFLHPNKREFKGLNATEGQKRDVLFKKVK